MRKAAIPAMEGAVGVIDMASEATAVDAGSGYGDPLAVHMYLLSPPQLLIVQHLCGEDVGSAEALEGTRRFRAQGAGLSGGDAGS